ncbi:hypothetical protein D3C76_1504660 [compost metagenome]
MMLVRISLALKCVRNHAVNPAHAAPARVPVSRIKASAQRLCSSMMFTANALPAKAPSSSWPSAPMFQIRAW